MRGINMQTKLVNNNHSTTEYINECVRHSVNQTITLRTTQGVDPQGQGQGQGLDLHGQQQLDKELKLVLKDKDKY